VKVVADEITVVDLIEGAAPIGSGTDMRLFDTVLRKLCAYVTDYGNRPRGR